MKIHHLKCIFMTNMLIMVSFRFSWQSNKTIFLTYWKGANVAAISNL